MVFQRGLPDDPTQATVAGVVQPAVPKVEAGLQATASPQAQGVTQPQQQPRGMAPAAQGSAPRPASIGVNDVEDDSVSGRLAAITAQDSPVMQQARSQGMRAANARGLLNSSIAIGAAQDSVYRVAAPLAAQEAGQAAARNNTRVQVAGQLAQIASQAGFDKEARADQFGYASAQQKAEIDARFALMDKDFGNQSKLQQGAQAFTSEMAKLQQGYAVDNAKLQATLQSVLQAQGNTEQMQRMSAEFVNQQQLAAQQGQQALAQIAANGDQEMKRQATIIQASMQELVVRLNQQNTEAAASAAMQLFNAEAQIRAALLSNTTIPAAERQSYMNAVSNLTGPTRMYINQLLGVQPTPAGMAPAGAPAGAATPGGVTADGRPIYYAPSGGGTAIGGMNPYVNWQ